MSYSVLSTEFKVSFANGYLFLIKSYISFISLRFKGTALCVTLTSIKGGLKLSIKIFLDVI